MHCNEDFVHVSQLNIYLCVYKIQMYLFECIQILAL